MAKSPVGGSRAFLKGRIGSDVYSLGKDGKGKRQQIVRALAEEVANPRTTNQMFGRMIMTTVMQAVHAFKPIIDHSFDGVAIGQPSISEFIRRNYQLCKEDAIAHPSSQNKFGLVKYGEKGARFGMWILSQGNAQYPAAISPANGGSALRVTVGSTLTYGALKTAWGLKKDEYITLLSCADPDNANDYGKVTLLYCRMHLKEHLDEATVLTAANFLDAFDLDANFTPDVRLADGVVSLTNGDDNGVYYGMAWSIVTRKKNSGYIHSTCQLTVGNSGIKFNSDTALPTYPVGEEQFLNGGEL